MKICEKCKCQMDDLAAFCGECGTPVKKEVYEQASESAVDTNITETEDVTEVAQQEKSTDTDKNIQIEQMVEKTKEIGGKIVSEAAVKGKKTAVTVATEFKNFDYKTLKTKDGWRSFFSNKIRVISLIVAVVVVVVLFSTVGGGSKMSDEELEAIFIMALDEEKVMSPFSASYADLLPEVFSSYEWTYEPYQSSDVSYIVTFSGEYAPNPDLDYVVEEGAISFLINTETGDCSIQSVEGSNLIATFKVYAANGY